MAHERTSRHPGTGKAPDRTGEYGGDGALEHERAGIRPGEDPGLTGTAARAERQQRRNLETGAEKPGARRPPR